MDEAPQDPRSEPPRRTIGDVPHVLLLSGPRVVLEGLRRRLVAAGVPVHLETPFTATGLPEAYIGTYMGDVSLWVPEALQREAEMIIERDSEGEL